jgi:hypothetical protein
MGDTWWSSIDLTTQQDREKLPLMGMLPDENTLSRHDGISSYGNSTALAESPFKEGVLWVGTDDGNLQLSKDGGKTWANLIGKFDGLPSLTYVSRIVASQHDEERTYVAFDGHRNDDFNPYVFVTEDLGMTWTSLSGDLPVGSTVNVIREHHRNPDLLFLGTERGAYFSIDRGQRWARLEGNLPMVPVDDIAIHPRENDLILGTHGRSVLILDDITPLEQLSADVFESESHLFTIRPAERFQYYDNKGFTHHKMFIAPNPLFGAIITYYLKDEQGEEDNVTLTILDQTGSEIRKLEGTKKQGFNRLNWDLRYERAVSGDEGSRSSPSAPFVIPGEYTVKLTAAGTNLTTSVAVDLDPRITTPKAELIAQRDIALELNQMYAKGYRANETLQALEKQIQDLKERLEPTENLDESITSDMDAMTENIKDIRLKLMGERGRRDVRPVVGSISSLSRNITGYTAAPTAKQVERKEQFARKLDEVLEEVNNLIEGEIPKLNQKLSKGNILLQRLVTVLHRCHSADQTSLDGDDVESASHVADEEIGSIQRHHLALAILCG